LLGHSGGLFFVFAVALMQHPGGLAMQSSVVKRSIVVAGHKTSISLEDDFWRMMKEVAKEREVTLSELVAKIDSERQIGNLSSAIRLFVLRLCREKLQKYEAADRTKEILANAISSAAPFAHQ
jgi:predicted DNA-binding ribbon-helix-helix protein